jgi:hypothetical protein
VTGSAAAGSSMDFGVERIEGASAASRFSVALDGAASQQEVDRIPKSQRLSGSQQAIPSVSAERQKDAGPEARRPASATMAAIRRSFRMDALYTMTASGHGVDRPLVSRGTDWVCFWYPPPV